MSIKAALLAVLAVAGGTTAAHAKATAADAAFLTQEMQGARYEIALAKLAQTRGTTPAIKAYARKIVADHSQANPALMQLGKAEGVAFPAGMTSGDTAKLARLGAARGKAFDTAYVAEVTRINAEDEASFKKEAAATRDPRIKAYVARFSSMDAAHKKMGEALGGN